MKHRRKSIAHGKEGRCLGWFTEKFLEDCIAEAPTVFLGRSLTLLKQQPKIGGFIPDLLFTDILGQKVIVEVQKNALDRHHLYRCLEYRDSISEIYNENTPEIVLVCENFPERYTRIAKTHNVIVIEISREKIIENACLHCPSSLLRHLTTNNNVDDQKRHELESPKLEPYRWSEHQSLSDVYGSVMEEMGRCGYSETAQRGNFGEILYKAQCLLEGSRGFNELLDPTGWRIEGLIGKPDKYVPKNIEDYIRIRKPRAEIHMLVTSKDNLSVRWRPIETKFNGKWYFDWAVPPSEEPYAYQRPQNEILFIRDIGLISPDPDNYIHHHDGDQEAAFHSMLLALIWAMLSHIKSTLGRTLEIHFEDEFELITEKETHSHNEEFSRGGKIITGWRIIDKKSKEIEDATDRTDNFSKSTGIELESIFNLMKEIIKKPFKGDIESCIAKELRNVGYKITVTPIRILFSDLITTNNFKFLEIYNKAQQKRQQAE